MEQQIVKALVEHWPLAVAFSAVGWWFYKHGLPASIRLSLMNGGGEVVKGILVAENAAQENRIVQHVEGVVRKVLGEHERREEERFRSIEARLPRGWFR